MCHEVGKEGWKRRRWKGTGQSAWITSLIEAPNGMQCRWSPASLIPWLTEGTWLEGASCLTQDIFSEVALCVQWHRKGVDGRRKRTQWTREAYRTCASSEDHLSSSLSALALNLGIPSAYHVPLCRADMEWGERKPFSHMTLFPSSICTMQWGQPDVLDNMANQLWQSHRGWQCQTRCLTE